MPEKNKNKILIIFMVKEKKDNYTENLWANYLFIFVHTTTS